MPASTLRATVQQDGTTAGQAAVVLVDGATTFVTANGVAGYVPKQDDRVLVQQVGGQVEIIQFLNRDFITGQTIRTSPSGERWEMQGGTSVGYANQIVGFTGNAIETTPATISTQDFGASLALQLASENVGGGVSELQLIGYSAGGGPGGASNAIAALAALVQLGSGSTDRVEVPGTLKIGPGQVFVGQGHGALSTTTNASGQVSVTHGFGFTPQGVFCSSATGNALLCVCTNFTSTTFLVTVRSVVAGGATLNNTAVDLRFFGWA